LLVVILLGFFFHPYLFLPTETGITKLVEVIPTKIRPLPFNVTHARSMYVPAVDAEGRGVLTLLKVEVKPGYGRTLVNIDQLYFWVDTQHSIRIAKQLAQQITGVDVSNIDLVYTIETNASIIGGESAGAAIAVATIALLQNKTINPRVMMTGTIDEEGRIGKVGAVLAKAIVARDAGMELFLVPEGQAVQTYYEAVEECRQIGPITYCTTDYVPRRIDISEQVGIEVKEVVTIEDALNYYLVE